MAVTVTSANPATTVKPFVQGAYGALAAGASVDITGVQLAKRAKVTKLTLSGTYATNGFALVPSAYGLKEIHAMLVVADGNSGAPYVPQLTAPGASPVVKLVTDAVPTELTNTTATIGVFTVLLIGI